MASLKDTLKSDLTVAMKSGDEVGRSTLRMALSAITNAEVAGDEAVELSDDQVTTVLQAEAKKRAELAVLEKYLPAAMSEAEVAAIVAEEVAAAAAAGNAGPKSMGLVVKAVRSRVGSSADGSLVAQLVKAALA
jgi:uncharacterized protein YqeY